MAMGRVEIIEDLELHIRKRVAQSLVLQRLCGSCLSVIPFLLMHIYKHDTPRAAESRHQGLCATAWSSVQHGPRRRLAEGVGFAFYGRRV